MTMPTTQFQVLNPPAQNSIAGAHLHTPPSIFEHMMAQQNIPHQPGSWSQMPHVPPMYMPWSVPSIHQPQLMRFTGEKAPPVWPSTLHQKRKIDVPEIPDTRPRKQFISEEKMTAHFQDMHISTNFSPTSCSTSTNYNTQPQPSTSSQIDVNVDTSVTLENGKSIHPKLVLSEELKRIQQEPLLPASLLSKLERPSMALVLWEPPCKHLRVLTARPAPSLVQSSTAEPEDEDNNNNESSHNNNNNSNIINNNNNNNNNLVMNNNNYTNNNNNQQMPDFNRLVEPEQNNVPVDLRELPYGLEAFPIEPRNVPFDLRNVRFEPMDV